MAMQTFNPWLPPYELSLTRSTTGVNGFTLDASGEKLAYIFRAPRACELSKATIRFGTITTPQDVKVSFQDVDVATGDPDGTADQYRVIPSASVTTNTFVRTGIISSDGTDGGSKRTLAAGELFAVVMEFDSSVGVISIAAAAGVVAGGGALGTSYVDHYTGAWAKATSNFPTVTLECSDGSILVADGVWPAFSNGTTSFNNGSATYRYGNIFTLGGPARACGAWAVGDFDGDCNLVLYDSDGTTVLGTCAADKDVRAVASTSTYSGYFTEVNLSASVAYRLAVVPSSATSLTLAYIDVRAQLDLDALGFGQNCYETKYNGSWVQTVTRRNMCGIRINGISDGAGGGAKYRPRMRRAA